LCAVSTQASVNVSEQCDNRQSTMKGWAIGWFIVGAAGAVALLAVASIGLFLAPVVAAAAVGLARVAPARSALFAMVGAGAVLVVLGLLNLDYRPCPNHAIGTTEGESYSCGGLRPAVTIGLGLLLAAGGVVRYATLRPPRIPRTASY
jgi:hypothetical protein